MFAHLAFFISAQIIFIVVFSIVGLVKVKHHQHTLQQESTAGNTSLEAYQRFAAATDTVLGGTSNSHHLFSLRDPAFCSYVALALALC